MGRPGKSVKRNRQLNLKLTEREYAWVIERAVEARMKPVDFGRAQLFADGKVRRSAEARPHLDPLFMAQLSRIGSNLNQIVRRLHQLHMPAPGELDGLLASIREIIRTGAADGS